MIILTGDTRSRKLIERLKVLGWGRLSVVARPKPYPGEPWGIDNGAYSSYLKGEPLNIERFRKRCDESAEMEGCMMAVLPDKVGAGSESLDYSMEYLEKLPKLPWYLAVQDGMEAEGLNQTEKALDDPRIEGIFLGGTLPFKMSIDIWAQVAKSKGKKLHYGRCGTPKKINHALRSKGVTSLDSAFPLWTMERWMMFEKAVAGKLPQLTFEDQDGDFFDSKV